MTQKSHGDVYLTPTERHWACDIEADNLLDKATTIWCVCVLNCITRERHDFTTAAAFRAWLDDHGDAILVGHNFIAYDLVMLNRHWNAKIGIKRVVDTFVLSQMYQPTLKGGHSLEDWGRRLCYPKGDFNDFSQFSEPMLRYCRRDVNLTALLFRKLTERMRKVGFTEFGCEIEHLAWNIIQNKQRRFGFPFNYQKAQELYVSLRAREKELQDEIYKLWPPVYQVVRSFKRAKRQDGAFTADYNRCLGKYPELRIRADGGFDAYDYVSFNLGSPQQRIEKLLELGWTPTSFTKKTDKGGGGNPQVDEESLLNYAELTGRNELVALARWIVVNARANMVATWMAAYNPETKAIHGSVWLASTMRYRHDKPNTANIPAVKTEKVDGKDQVLYGEAGAYCYETRDLWDCGDYSQWSLVGLDGKGIQLRVLANYAYSEGFVANVLAGDPHTNNIKVLGLANKPAAKKFLYTTLMGGGGAKLAADQAQFGTKLSEADGSRLKKLLIDSIPGFGDVIKAKQRELDRTGRITLCDGTPILVSSPHMVIPYLLQGDESRLMKLALVYVYECLRAAGTEALVRKVADIHDEWQFQVRTDYVEDFIQLALPCFLKAGEAFGYRVPIEGDAKVGKTWAETH